MALDLQGHSFFLYVVAVLRPQGFCFEVYYKSKLYASLAGLNDMKCYMC
jgi:hypothetical protein